MKHTDFERNSALENRPKTAFHVRNDVILLKSAIRKAENHIFTLERSRYTYVNIDNAMHHVRQAKRIVNAIFYNEEFEYNDIMGVVRELNLAQSNVYVTPIRDAIDIAIELIADDPIPYRVTESDSPIGTIVPKNNPCDQHAKGGWYTDNNGKQKFLMPPHPGVDEICPRCGGYANETKASATPPPDDDIPFAAGSGDWEGDDSDDDDGIDAEWHDDDDDDWVESADDDDDEPGYWIDGEFVPTDDDGDDDDCYGGDFAGMSCNEAKNDEPYSDENPAWSGYPDDDSDV